MNYQDFLNSKKPRVEACGIEPGKIHPTLFPWQQDIVRLAVQQGRFACFADCGLGKSLMQIEWCRQFYESDGNSSGLIVAPLSVAQQTIQEAKKIGVNIRFISERVDEPGIFITNYQKLHKFTDQEYRFICLDESSILKSLDGKTRTLLLERFTSIPYRSCWTATPSPNDVVELLQHSEFLGIKKAKEAQAEFFIHDSAKGSGSGYRLRKWGVERFWEWVSEWSVYIRYPSDLGYPDENFVLPELNITESIVNSKHIPDGKLFPDIMKGIVGRTDARRSTLSIRVQRAVEVIEGLCQKEKLDTGKNITQITESGDLKSQSNTEGNTQKKKRRTTKNGTQKTENGSEQRIQKEELPIPTRQESLEEKTIENISTDIFFDQKNGKPPILNENTIETSERTTGSLSNISINSTNHSMESVLFAEMKSQGEEEAGYASITVTRQEKSEDSFVLDVISESANSRIMVTTCGQQPITSKDQWLVWCGLNDEGRELAAALKSGDFKTGALVIEGSTPEEDKILFERLWREGEVKTLIVKPSQFGFGLNWQNCHNVLYLGLSDSFEQWYQSIRRCWRFGQKYPVNVVVVTSDAEMRVVDNVRRKEKQAANMAEGIVRAMKEKMKEKMMKKVKVKGVLKEKPIEVYTKEEHTDQWSMILDDCVSGIKAVPDNKVGHMIFSPPFSNKLFVFNDDLRDMSNCTTYEGFLYHFSFLCGELLRVMMPGRICAIHVQDVGLTQVNDGVIGRKEFTGDVRIEMEKAGWTFCTRLTIDKNNQAQSIRTHALNLSFQQFKKDSTRSWPCMADYLMIFQKPGKNPVPVKTDYSNEDWIKLSKTTWYDIDENDTLNARLARDEKDEAHLCPLQLEVIRRCIRLWSNPGELILDPFAGIGSTGVVAIEQDRRFIGFELKESYWRQAVKNLKNAVKQESLFEKAEG